MLGENCLSGDFYFQNSFHFFLKRPFCGTQNISLHHPILLQLNQQGKKKKKPSVAFNWGWDSRKVSLSAG
jgi:hypothetical protein